ncbi:MAG: Asp23/Gls24 family envelope stress response protein [Rubrobacteraceae bacterium]|nr:Asp23/Gls24 family envelope stress response protein [Rubrobacteraceae bacterium]
MSESERQHSESPLLSERGTTTISGTVVSSIAGMAAQEVEGVHMGGGGSRTASGVIGSITGSESKTSGISVDVGRTEAAIDLKMGIEYDKNILQTVEEVRRRITDRVETMTGLRVKELNATITDITFPEKEERRRLGSGSATSRRDDSPTDETSTVSETQTEPEPPITEVEPVSRTHTEGSSGPVPEEEVRVEDRPLEEGETTEVRAGDTETSGEAPEADTRAESEPSEVAETRADDETSETTEETRAETETSEQDAEARMRRRAEERVRRRRRSQDS